jgi:hypothetical protein
MSLAIDFAPHVDSRGTVVAAVAGLVQIAELIACLVHSND